MSLAIRGLPDEQLLMRQGGLYWVAVDRIRDAGALAR
jgi:hypothetical protein